ncbi:MAG: DUF222 domain-containing protein [Streptosporangiaceae bacterium]|jgi:hypothetical protein
MTVTPVFASAAEAADLARAGLRYLASADPTQLTAAEQAECLRDLERISAVTTAARARVLGGFTAGQGYCDDGAYSPRAWLIYQTRVTKGAAAGHAGWARRARAHPRILAAMAAEEMSESWARTICGWTGQLPEECQDAADEILAAAARQGMALRDLAALAAEIQSRAPRPDPGDDDPGKTFKDRGVRLETTFAGAGVLSGDLTPECASVLAAVLESLSAPRGALDTRSHAQRYHDALEEAMRRLVAAGLLPERAGQPVKAIAHIDLGDLMILDGDSVLQEQWAERVRARWAGYRAAASVSGSDGGAWLDGDAAAGFGCDASVTPVVFGDVNPAVLDDLVCLCVQLTGHGRPCTGTGHTGDPGPQTPLAAAAPPQTPAAPETPGVPEPGPVPPTARGREALERAIIGKAVALVSGPGGLASFLRRRQLGARLAGPSLPLDVGVSRGIPAAIRTAVIQRDQHCRFPDGCDQPAAACEIHHTTPQASGGKTSVEDCGLFCFFHHHVVIHQWGWTVVLNPDGTTTAYSPDKTKILHSHGPPLTPSG